MVGFLAQMTNKRLDELIRKTSAQVEGEAGLWQIQYEGRDLMIVTDEEHDRMRIMTPVVPDDVVDDDECRKVLMANFDRALDARFAIAKGFLWSVFIHPLSTLSACQFFDALDQVKTLAENFGTSYGSTDIVFHD